MHSEHPLREDRMISRERSCCRNCDYESIRRSKSKSDRPAQNEGDKKQIHRRKQELLKQLRCGTVNLHPHGIQLVFTVKAPPGFRLCLDFLPCFQGPPVKLGCRLGPDVDDPYNGCYQGPDTDDPYNNGWIADSSNGLLLCTTSKVCQTQYYVCNPVTKHWVALPSALKTSSYPVFVGFVFYPCTMFTNQDVHGPLPCSSSCRFKVVRFPQMHEFSRPKTQFEAEIYSSETGRWSLTTVTSPKEFWWGCPDTEMVSSLFHNGCLHWLAEGTVVVYDPCNNKLRGVIRPPPATQCCETDGIGGLGLSRNSLWMFQYSHTSLFIRLWELKGYGSNVSGDFNFDECYWHGHRMCSLRDCVGVPQQLLDFGNLLAIHPHDPDIVYFQFRLAGRGYAASCNLRTKVWGPIRFGYDGVRFTGDVLTLAFPEL